MKTTVLVKLDLRDPDLSRLREIARGAKEGKIVAFPTETVYGMGGPMTQSDLTSRLIALKTRDENKPFSYHIGELEMLEVLNVQLTPALKYLMRFFWPGPVTFLALNRSGEKIGLRYPRHRLATALINATGVPFIATSANLSGAPSPHTAEDVMNQLGGKIDYLIDGGVTELKQDSTVVDVTAPLPVMVRRGANAEAVEKAIEQIKLGKFPRKKILFVCTGNSCRSPMAAGWFSQQLRRKNLQDEIEVSSCGVGARNGASPTSEAILVMKNREIDIASHRSRPCSRADVMDADLIVAMSEEHKNFILGMLPSAKDRIILLDIPDPIGMGLMVYEMVIGNIEKKLTEMWNQLVA